MPKPSRCIVEGCPNPSHAKGYCRRHYGQIWRRGMIYNDSPREKTDYDSNVRRDDQERLRALERELKRAQQMYDVVVGFQGRIKWRREIEAVQTEIRKILDSQPAGTPESVEIAENAVAEAAATQA
ncbi:MAG: hypothetical protein HY291_17605 [Planctomycetes bacterium]|nr:hypothetical protein [Planctomycetota bacterium]